MSRLDALLAALYHPDLRTIEPGLERMVKFLEALGDPHARLPPVIHIAGTNGKGSLLAYLRSVFAQAGLRAHAYTSPHLLRFNERIVLGGKEIGDDALTGYLEPVLALAWKVPVTFFEATTAAAFSAFAEHPADVLLLEVGMGGRLDATNVIEKPALTVITPVALDHCEYLGGTLEAVAREKAGIIKRGMKCVVGRQHPQAMEVILHTAKVLEAPVYAMHEAWQVEAQGGEGVYTSAGYRLRFRPALAGRHQIDNAATAIACLECLPQWHFTDEAVRHGLAAAEWPARLQRLADQGEKEVWLDGGHNPHGAEALAAWAAEKPDAALLLVCGLMRRKDAKRFFAPFASHARKLFAVGIPGEEESYPAAELAALAAAAGIPSAASSSLDAALAAALREAPPKGRILICGSLYLAGKVLSSMVS